jgi:hypothetical protein
VRSCCGSINSSGAEFVRHPSLGLYRGHDFAEASEARPLLPPSEIRNQLGLTGFEAALIGVSRWHPILDRQAAVLRQRVDVRAPGP